MEHENPTSGEDRLCMWCGGPIQQSGRGRRRDYCSRTHREYAYRARREAQIRLKGYLKGQADAHRSISSTDGNRSGPNTSVDETRRPDRAPAKLPSVVAKPSRPEPKSAASGAGAVVRQPRRAPLLPPPPGVVRTDRLPLED
jgi:hypothetical protein